MIGKRSCLGYNRGHSYLLFQRRMNTLLRKPVLLMAVLCLPLWIIFGNFILAASASILISMLVGMVRTLQQLSRDRDTGNADVRTPPNDTPD